MFVTSVVTALVALPFVAQSAFATNCTRTYTIQEGDWCDTISAAKNVSTYQLAVVNSGNIDAACNNLTPGASICLGWEGQDCTTTYVVQKDDTCDLITQKHAINSTVLHANNPQLDADCNNLYIGEVLCAASTVAVPALPSGSPLPAATIPATATPAHTSYVVPTATPTAAPSDNSDDDCDDDDDDSNSNNNDDDLPWCDEL